MANEVYTYDLDEATDPVVQTLATELAKSGTATGDALVARALKDASNVTFVPTGATNPAARNLLDFLADIVNVRSYPQTQIGWNQAVADAKATSKRLFWPAGTYTIPASIPDFHAVRHVGPGVIKRVSASIGNCFYVIQPMPNAIGYNRFFINPTVSNAATNDGFTPETAFASFAQADAAFLMKGGELDGLWRVHLSAGTHTDLALSSKVKFKYPLEIQGADVGRWPNVPTTIIDGAVPIAGVPAGKRRGIDLSADHNVTLYDIKIQNYTAGYGISASNGDLNLANIHLIDNYININVRYHSRLNFLTSIEIGGVAYESACSIAGLGKNSASYGMFISFDSIITANFQDNEDDNVLKITDCGIGILVHEGSYGHTDRVWVQNCAIGYSAQRGAGNNTDQMRIWLCDVGMELLAGGNPLDNLVDYGEGTANACTVKIRYHGGQELYRRRDTLELIKTNGIDDTNIDLSYNVIGTAKTTFWTPMKIKAGDISPIVPAAIPGADLTIAGISYKVIHELFHRLGIVVSATQTQSITIGMYLGSVTAGNLVGFYTLSPGATGTFTEIEFQTDIVSTTVVKNATRRTGATASPPVYKRTTGLALRPAIVPPATVPGDIPVIFTAEWQAADPGAAISFRMGASYATFGRCPY